MKILLFGASGLLGSDIKVVFEEQGHTVINHNSKSCDITIFTQVEFAFISEEDIGAVINCAAYAKVDKAEEEPDLAWKINVLGTLNIALMCDKLKIPMVHFSTDYVFDGRKIEPYLETDETNPINYYGFTKLTSEKMIQNTLKEYYIFRIQWLYGKNGKNFVDTIIRKAKNNSELNIISDQFGSPTWTSTIASGVLHTLKNKIPYGTYHLANQKYTNWAEFAEDFLDFWEINCKINPIKTEDYPTLAKRPLNSRLNINKFLKTGIYTPNNWDGEIGTYFFNNQQAFLH